MSKTPRKPVAFVTGAAARSFKLLNLAGGMLKTEAARALRGESDLKARLAQAALLVEQLGHLKGAAMKVGQILALEARDFFPDEVVQVLEKLQSSATPMAPEEVRAILDRELGARARELERFSEAPIAAASIGQVHSASWRGSEVAVKIQYPGVADSLDSDLRILRGVVKAISTVSGRGDIEYGSLFEELRDVFVQETDYLREAELQDRYRKLASGLPWLQVPEAHREVSTGRVLVSEFVRGITVSDAARGDGLSRELRDFFGDCFLGLYAREFCEWGLVQTDPNLGNFLLQPEARRLVLLDFGATREYPREFRVTYSRLILAAQAEERARCLELVSELDLLDPREGAAAREALLRLLLESMRPFRSADYRFSDDAYTLAMRERTRALIAELRFSAPPRALVFLHRKLGGIFQILRRLDAALDLRDYLAPFERLAREG